MFTVVKFVSAFVSGGALALIGSIGGFVGETAAEVVKKLADYLWFDAENGYLKDYPDCKNDSLVQRIRRIMK